MPEKSKFSTLAFVGLCWHPDGTPFSLEDYRRAGHDVPTPEQLALWAANEKQRARRRKRKRASESSNVFHQNKD